LPRRSLTLKVSNPTSGVGLRAVVKAAFNEATKAALLGEIGVDVNVTECSNQIMGDYQVFRIRDSMITPRYRVRYFISAIVRCQSFLS